MLELVGQKTDLRRSGSQWMGVCPFHDERSASFSVNAEAKVYYCFGCQERGDAIRFVEQTEGLDFREAIEFLAERYNVELKLEKEDPQAAERRRRRERLMALVERAAGYYERCLWDSPEGGTAREYLAGRGLADQTLRTYRIGLAPAAGGRVIEAARSQGFTPAEVAAAGLGKEGRDAFRGRITFPLCDPRGRVLGFGARAMREGQQPKYLNTAENDLYKKRRQLFGIDHARAPAAKSGRIVAVEGYTDVLALHQAGFGEAVAIMGTAITEDQLKELSRAADMVYLALDADRAGSAATVRGALANAKLAKERGVELLVVPMPEGQDPAEFVGEKGAEGFAARLEQAMTVAEFRVRYVVGEADTSSPRGRDRALEEIRPIIGSLPQNSATRLELVSFVADRLDVPPDFVTTTLSATPAATKRPQGPAPTQADPAAGEKALLAMCLAVPGIGKRYLAELEDEHFGSVRGRRVGTWLLEHYDAPLAGLPADDEELVADVGEVVARSEATPTTETDLRIAFLAHDQRKVERLLRLAQREGNSDRVDELMRSRAEIRRKISEVGL